MADLSSVDHGVRVRRLSALVGILAYCALVGLAATWRGPYYEDETWYLNTVPQLHQHGFSRAFLDVYPGSAGPWYTVVHWAAEPITHLAVPGTRLINVTLILVVVIATAWISQLGNRPEPLLTAGALLATPVIIVVSGLALTEVPAMACCYLSIALLLAARTSDRSPINSVILAVIGGALFALAILGRQQYLLVLLLTPLLVIGAPSRYWISILVFLATALPLPLLIFSVWGGLVPQHFDYVGKGWAPLHGMLAFAYGGLLYCLFDVDWLKDHWLAVLLLALIGLGANLFANFLSFTPMKTVVTRFLSPDLVPIFGKVCGGLLIGAGVAFAGYLAMRAWAVRHNGLELFLVGALGAILFSAVKITHQFSSRYVSLAVPLMVAIAAGQSRPRYIRVGLLVVGALIGIASLYSYYTNPNNR